MLPFDLTTFEFILALAALIISAPLIVVAGYFLIILLFYFGAIVITLLGALWVGAFALLIVLWEAIRDSVRTWWRARRVKSNK
jgi:hypothetical protein